MTRGSSLWSCIHSLDTHRYIGECNTPRRHLTALGSTHERDECLNSVLVLPAPFGPTTQVTWPYLLPCSLLSADGMSGAVPAAVGGGRGAVVALVAAVPAGAGSAVVDVNTGTWAGLAGAEPGGAVPDQVRGESGEQAAGNQHGAALNGESADKEMSKPCFGLTDIAGSIRSANTEDAQNLNAARTRPRGAAVAGCWHTE